MILQMIFWLAVALIGYTYVLFPLLVMLRGRLRSRPFSRAEITPSVSLVIAAYNEADSIGSKLENIGELDYPNECLEVVVASDGSTDETEIIVSEFGRDDIKLLSLPRQGKAAALNAAVAGSSGEVLMFSDANSMFARDAVRALVAPFADPEVGGVAGNQSYRDQRALDDSGRGERSYWSFDRRLKQWESQAGNVISATGAIYAIRRTLFRPVPEGVTDDFVTSTGVIAQGYRLVFAADAVAYEPVASSSNAEFGRKVRVITRGLRAVIFRRKLLNPVRYGFYSLQLFSHKVLRRLVVFPLIVLLLVAPLLWPAALFYKLATLAQLTFYTLAVAGYLLREWRVGKWRPFSLPFFFCLVNLAALKASINVLTGRTIARWDPERGPSPEGTAEARGTSARAL